MTISHNVNDPHPKALEPDHLSPRIAIMTQSLPGEGGGQAIGLHSIDIAYDFIKMIFNKRLIRAEFPSMKKTNAARYLDSLKIAYRLCEYEVDESDLSAESVARKVNLPLEQVFKTLVARGDRTGVLLACIPGGMELDLKAVAEVSGNKKVEMVALKEVLPLTGYVRGGVSPIGTKKRYSFYLDESAMNFPFISISAGTRGCQIFIEPRILVKVLPSTLGKISHHRANVIPDSA